MRTALISGDVFDIARRVKEIDRCYRIRYNRLLSRYELHHIRYYPDTLVSVIPYPTLDKRTIDYVLKTRVHNLDKLLDEMDSSNLRLEERKEREILDETAYKTKNLIEYIDKGGTDIPSFNEI